MNPNEGQNIVERIRRGDRAAENELYRQFNSRIHHLVRMAVGYANDDRQDLVSEIQLAVLESVRKGSYDPQKGVVLGAYVYGIARNKLRDYYKASKRRERVIQACDEEPHALDKYEADEKEIQDLLHQLLSRLKIKYQQVLYLRFYDQLSVAEISERIKLPPRRVSERLNYAVKLLRKECMRKKISIFFVLTLISICTKGAWIDAL